MKPIYVKFAMICFLFTGILSAQQSNTAKVSDNEFILKAFKSRMIATNEAMLASKKATSSSIRQYAGQLVRDENTMYQDLKKMGAERNIIFPKSINAIDTSGRVNLTEVKGAAFDRKYVAMLTADLQNDIALFMMASESADEKISSYARKSLPMLQRELDVLKTLK